MKKLITFIFYPATHLMNRLNYPKRFATLGVMALMAIGIVLANLYACLQQTIQLSLQESQGIALIEPLSRSIQTLQQHRVISAGLLAGDISLYQEQIVQDAEFRTAFQHLKNNLPAELILTQEWRSIEKDETTLVTQGLSLDVEKNRLLHNRLIDQLHDFEMNVADQYALLLDAEADSHYLITVTIQDLPEVLETFGQLRTLGTAILAKKSLTDTDRISLKVLILQIDHDLKNLKYHFNKASQHNPAMETALDNSLLHITEVTQKVIFLVTTDILQEKLTLQPNDFFNLASTAIEKSYQQIYLSLLPTTQKLIAYRLAKAESILHTSIGIAALMFGIVTYLAGGIYLCIISSIQSLSTSARAFAKGHLAERVHLKTRDELNRIGKSFNEMADGFTKLLLAHQKDNAQLQAAQIQLLQAEKMAALGQLIAGIAHEINTPLGAISSSVHTLQRFLEETLTLMPPLFQTFSTDECQEFLTLLTTALNTDTSLLSAKEQRQKRHALVEQLESKVADALAIADTLVDMGIYTEIEPIVVLLQKNNGREILELAYKLSELKKGTRTIAQASERTAKVVFALKTYAHQDYSGKKVKANLLDSLEMALTLYANQMRQGVQLIKHYADDLPLIDCYPDELNQVWTNLIHNALQAMNHQGVLTLTVVPEDQYLKIAIQDTGMGITAENLDKIFEAFYTTKNTGEGSGLGLHIVKKIIDKHDGKIKVKSEMGSTVFSVLLPINIP